jgi:hypothetical protein
MMWINEVNARFGVDNQFKYTAEHFKWVVDFNYRPDLSTKHLVEAEQWCVINLADEDFVVAPRKFYFRYLTDATLFRLQFS